MPLPHRVLLVIAAPAEVRAVLAARGRSESPEPWRLLEIDDRFDLVVSGIGKGNAAGATARVADPSRHLSIISLGIAGALPESGVQLGDVVLATRSVYADEGLQNPDNFQTCDAMGFPIAPPPAKDGGVETSPELMVDLRRRFPEAREGVVATVSTCSGTDALARQVRQRTRAIAEGMEGAAVAHAAVRLGIRSGEIRIISNTTGDRPKQVWDIRRALRVLGDVARRLG